MRDANYTQGYHKNEYKYSGLLPGEFIQIATASHESSLAPPVPLFSLSQIWHADKLVQAVGSEFVMLV